MLCVNRGSFCDLFIFDGLPHGLMVPSHFSFSDASLFLLCGVVMREERKVGGEKYKNYSGDNLIYSGME